MSKKKASPELSALALADRFHAIYERLAPKYGYETRPETQVFDIASANGRLMIAVCDEIIQQYTELSESVMNKIIKRLKLEAKMKDDEATLRPQNEAWLHGVAEGLKEAGDIVVFFRNRAITNKEPNTEISGSLRSNQPSTTRESLSSSLDRASKNVQSWPQWKQQAAGADLYSSTKDEYNK